MRDQMVESGVLSIDTLLAGVAADRRYAVLRSLHWMIKIGLLRVANNDLAT